MSTIPVPPPEYRKRTTGSGLKFTVIIMAFEAVFGLFLYASLATRVLTVKPAGAAAGVPQLISYQGMLTDSSGNPLGGASSTYCFRYSIWDVASAGTTSTDQLWPQPALGDASTTPSNSTTTVIDGIFSDQLGRTDTFGTLDFGANTTSTQNYYLQVQVSTSSLTCATGLETLSPRQQINSDAWAQTSKAVYSSQLRTLSAINTVQIGTGAGTPTPGNQTLLSLDVVTTGESIGGSCNTNGTLWYDSNLGRVLVCEGSIIQPISDAYNTDLGWTSATFTNITNSAATTTLISTTGVGTTTIPANSMKEGSSITLYMYGVIKTATTAPTIQYFSFLGTNFVASVSAASTASLANAGFELRCTIVILSTGASGVWVPGCMLTTYGTSGTTSDHWSLAGTTSTVNTTIANKVDLQFKFGTASTTNAITSTITSIQFNM